MCCLAFERDYYMEVAERLPRIGSKVETIYGEGTVAAIDIFSQTVVVVDESGNQIQLPADSVKVKGKHHEKVDEQELVHRQDFEEGIFDEIVEDDREDGK